MRIPQLVAHRGYPQHYPENSLIGLEAAIYAGARYVEIGVQLTRDLLPRTRRREWPSRIQAARDSSTVIVGPRHRLPAERR